MKGINTSLKNIKEQVEDISTLLVGRNVGIKPPIKIAYEVGKVPQKMR